MKVLVINCGSSSLKYQLVDMTDETVLAKGLCDRIALEGSLIKHEPNGKDTVKMNVPMPTYMDAVKAVVSALVSKEHGVIESVEEIQAVGHRVVHGAESFTDSCLITEDVIKVLEDCSELAPLHNPANITGIRAFQQLLPNAQMVAVFDTAFHQTMPKKAYLYALPYEYYRKYKVRRYGFHGTSHKYVSQRAAEMLGKNVEDLKIIVCHLGNGASLCAIDGGKSIDTTMGLTPLEGLMMGTRCGDLDPAIIQYIAKKEDLNLDQVIDVLNKKSGALGIYEKSSDFRHIEDAVNDGEEQAILTMDVFEYRVAKYIGAYAVAMGGLDALCFAGGLGENNPDMRVNICKYLEFLGMKIDLEKNKVRGKERIFSTDDSKIKAMLVPTNEELMIARETYKLV